MRLSPLALAPALLLTLACNSKLTLEDAGKEIARRYPVYVPLVLPQQATAEKGSPSQKKLQAIKENLERTGWIETQVEAKGKTETYTFHRTANAPKHVHITDKDRFSIAAAQAVFVRAVKLEANADQARVTYEIRLENPTAQFPLFQDLHPSANLGSVKTRNATFERQGRKWVMVGNSEVFMKVD